MTNADKIRSLTDDELQFFICEIHNSTSCTYCGFDKGDCGCGLLDWLKQEEKENNDKR